MESNEATAFVLMQQGCVRYEPPAFLITGSEFRPMSPVHPEFTAEKVRVFSSRNEAEQAQIMLVLKSPPRPPKYEKWSRPWEITEYKMAKGIWERILRDYDRVSHG